MNYALIENGVVTNLIWLYPANAAEFPGAVPLGDVPAAIGDTWDGTRFLRGRPAGADRGGAGRRRRAGHARGRSRCWA